jgi:Ca2+-binding EF-hand superfamily protein
MKNVALSLMVVITMSSYSTMQSADTSTLFNAATLLSSMSSNCTVQQVASLFTLLDTNGDEAISSTEAIGSVADNFDILDTDSNSSLNLSELTGLLGLLK